MSWNIWRYISNTIRLLLPLRKSLMPCNAAKSGWFLTHDQTEAGRLVLFTLRGAPYGAPRIFYRACWQLSYQRSLIGRGDLSMQQMPSCEKQIIWNTQAKSRSSELRRGSLLPS